MFSKGGAKKSATPGWVTILHYMMIIRQKLQRERREGKSFFQRCKRCDGEKKEGINARMMRNLYPGDRDRCYDWLLSDMGIQNRKSKHV